MPWGQFFTIIAQVVISAGVLFVIAAVVIAVGDSIDKQDKS
jgi:hypothetical protein